MRQEFGLAHCPEQRVEVIARGEDDVGGGESASEGALRGALVRPATRAKVAVECDAMASRPGSPDSFCQPFASGLVVEGQRYAGVVDQIVAGELLDQGRRVRALEQGARRRAIAPVGEAPFPRRVGLDYVKSRDLAGPALYETRADALGLPAGDHLVAPAVVAQDGHVIDRRSEAGEVDRRVERVAAVSAGQAAIRLLPKFDHAFADAGDPVQG
jgi:hypothetical protein